jgi:uncharacterized membrane protein YhdT
MDNNTVPILTEKQRNAQIRKEARVSLLLYALFVVWLFVIAYGLGLGDPANYTYVAGLPLWFVLSCVVGPTWFCIASSLLVKYYFKDFDLEQVAEEKEEVTQSE